MFSTDQGGGGAYHGMPSFSSDWTTINQEKMPRQMADAARTMMIQMLSWSSGQW